MNKIFKLTLILCLVCAITAGVLGVVNELTYDRIQEQNRIKTENAYKHVLLAQGYEDIGYEDVPGGIIDKISRGTGGEGYVVELTFSGAQGNITLAVGVDSQLLCSGISVISHSETSGLGAVAASSSEKGVEWRSQFVGQGADVAITKAGGHIEAISGATITSRSIAEAVAVAIDTVSNLG